MTTARSSTLNVRPATVPALTLAAVGVMTLVALVLRLTGLHESLFGDELYSYEIITQPGLADVHAAIDRTENNPPLFYVLAWAAAKLGDPTITIRLPSLVFSTATVPIIYLLGLRALNRRAGLLGASLFALSPFAIFFGSEARAYSLLVFLVALSTLLLLNAADRRSAGWWVAYALCAVSMIYAHYTGVLALTAQAAWALWRLPDGRREVVTVYAAVGLAGLAWLPSYLGQDTPPLAGFRILGAPPFSPETFVRELVVFVTGHPLVKLIDVPGRAALTLLALAALVALVSGAAILARSSAPRTILRRDLRASSGPVLIGLLALAAPVGATVYSLFGTDIFYARNLSASLPAVYLALGAGLASLRRPVFLTVLTLAVAGLVAGLVKALDDDQNRPPFKQAAEFIDREARPGDPVVELTFASLSDPLGRGIEINFEHPHDLFTPGMNDRQAWARGARGARVFLLIPQVGALAGVPRRSGPGGRYVLRNYEIFPGFTAVGVFEFTRDSTKRR